MRWPDPRCANTPTVRKGHSEARNDKPSGFTCTPIEVILRALESATGIAPKQTGRGWRSACPSCGGRSAKLSIGEADNGGVLIHCFAGCDASAILQSAGLQLSDLMPTRDGSPEGRRAARQMMREADWRAALAVLGFEASVVAVCGHDALTGELTKVDLDRLHLALGRIDLARTVLQ